MVCKPLLEIGSLGNGNRGPWLEEDKGDDSHNVVYCRESLEGEFTNTIQPFVASGFIWIRHTIEISGLKSFWPSVMVPSVPNSQRQRFMSFATTMVAQLDHKTDPWFPRTPAADAGVVQQWGSTTEQNMEDLVWMVGLDDLKHLFQPC
ncbi:hypothetical protein DUI87_06954 [Hirundo rustica rustica]|uniref:Uncharacterized protein n=1 Tax=Hirundo rustica rustica TaxID=333673 RepID=A0A3M0KNG8_HIRRU|nr:hypothetical protein DUI87_06954 [Hirundo rustica rustica]